MLIRLICIVNSLVFVYPDGDSFIDILNFFLGCLQPWAKPEIQKRQIQKKDNAGMKFKYEKNNRNSENADQESKNDRHFHKKCHVAGQPALKKFNYHTFFLFQVIKA